MTEATFLRRCAELFSRLNDVNVARGVVRRAKDCSRAKRWRRKNPTKNKRRLRQWRTKNRPRAREITKHASRRYRQRHLDRVLVSNRKYRRRRSPEQRAKDNRRNAQWRKNNPKYHLDYYRKNREHIKALERNRYKIKVSDASWDRLKKGAKRA